MVGGAYRIVWLFSEGEPFGDLKSGTLNRLVHCKQANNDNWQTASPLCSPVQWLSMSIAEAISLSYPPWLNEFLSEEREINDTALYIFFTMAHVYSTQHCCP